MIAIDRIATANISAGRPITQRGILGSENRPSRDRGECDDRCTRLSRAMYRGRVWESSPGWVCAMPTPAAGRSVIRNSATRTPVSGSRALGPRASRSTMITKSRFKRRRALAGELVAFCKIFNFPCKKSERLSQRVRLSNYFPLQHYGTRFA